MHELSRLAYLESMGIDSYVSRSQLPGAAPSSRLYLRGVADATPLAEPVRTPAGPRDAGPTASTAAPPRSPAPVPPVRQQPPANEAPSRFSLAAVVAGGRLWLEELDQGLLASEQVQLMRAMAHALGWVGGTVDSAQFDWPLHNNRQLDLGPEAAAAALAGYLARRLDEYGCAGLVLLGDAACGRLRGLVPDLPRIECEFSSAQMLRDPGLKKRAWLALAGHAMPR